jgi:outer membrane protein assembly factor BamB
MPSLGSRPWLRRGLVAVTVLLLALAGTVTYVLMHAPGNVSHPNVEFTAPPQIAEVPPPPTPPPPKVVDNFLWPWYGFDAGRTRALANSGSLHPPLHQGWFYDDGGLLEFPPVIYQGTLYLVDENGWVRALDKHNGHVLWSRRVGTLAAASPAIDATDQFLLVPLLSQNPQRAKHPRPGNGRFVALSMANGRVVWSHPIPAGTESSPIALNHTVYFGDQSGTVYALRARDGHLFWTYRARGAVKGGPALADGRLFFGDYAGRAYALDSATGHEVWSVGTNGAHYGFGSGEFYSTPAVAFGRVYMGNTDGRVYSFAERTGQLAWATATGAYVYASPAVQDTPGLGPTVYIGSYDGHLYAFNARSGAVRWAHQAGGRISGSATIVGNVVYYANLGTKKTAGVDARTGRQVFSFHDGLFNPVVADYGALYMIGYTSVYQMLPGSPQQVQKQAAEPTKTARAKPARSPHRRPPKHD